jgi:hypothetical protein
MLRIIAAALAAFLWVAPAEAHTITWPDGQTFTFDTACCNATDCEAVPMSAIKEAKGGYEVDYWTHLTGTPRHVKGFVPHGSKNIRFNPFADRVMACSSYYTNKDGTVYPRCIYPVQPSM